MERPTSDRELMMAVRRGETGRLGELFDRHHARLYGFLVRLTGDPAAAEDLVQEVFLRALKYRRSYRADSEFLPWIFTLARNAATDSYHRASRQPEGDPERLAAAPDRRPPADVRVDDRQRLRALERALGALPPERRLTLVLARFEARGYAEIAQLLGCSVGAVKVRVHRAAKQLRELYAETLNEAT